MDDVGGEQSEPDFVLAVLPPPTQRRLPWSVQPPQAPRATLVPVEAAVAVATIAPPPVPPPASPGPPDPPPGPRRAAAEAIAGARLPESAVVDAAAAAHGGSRRLDRRWWTSTLASTIVHVVVLTILALIVTVPERLAPPKPLRIGQPADDMELAAFAEPEEFAAVEIAPPDPVVDAAAAEPALVDADVAADAAGLDVADGFVELDAAALVARIGGGGAAAGGGAAGGFGGDIGRRLRAAGANTGDVQVSLSWDNFNDVDLHVVAPSGERIFFAHRASRCRGLLDVDMNALGPESREPVENVFWPAKRAPPGEYRVFVHHYSRFDPDEDDTTFTVHVLVNGRKERFTGSVKSGDPPSQVAAFRRAAGDEAADEFVE